MALLLAGIKKPPRSAASCGCYGLDAARATRKFRAWACFVDAQRPRLEVLFVHAVDRCLGGTVIRHFHKTKAAGTAAFAVHDHFRGADFTEGFESRTEIIVAAIPRQVTDINIHYNQSILAKSVSFIATRTDLPNDTKPRPTDRGK